MATLVSIWGVSRARTFSDELMQYWDEPPFNFDLNWMVYLSAPLARQSAPPAVVLVERTEDGGLYLIAAEKTFDTENPRHMAAAHRISTRWRPSTIWRNTNATSRSGSKPTGCSRRRASRE